MATTFIYGAPRSGKTYYAVHHLLKTFFDWAKETGSYHLKEKYKDIRIVTNIEDLKVPHDNLDLWIKKAGGVDVFFSYDFQEDLYSKCPQIVYLIDECHKYFPDNYRNNDVFEWFSYHGHWGQTIYLLSQSLYNVPRRITNLIETSLFALPRSSTLFGGRDLKYNVVCGRDIIDKKTLIKNKRIFEHYKSQDSEEVEKVKNPMMKYIVVMLVILAFLGFKLSGFIAGKKGGVSSGQAIASQLPDDKMSAADSNMNHKKQNQLSPVNSENNDLQRVRISTIRDSRGLFLVLGDIIIPKRDFPHPVRTFGNQYIAMLTPEQIEYYGLAPSGVDAQERAGTIATEKKPMFALRN